MKGPVDMANRWVSRLATYEPGKPIDETARELGLDSADKIVKLASNENPLGPSPKAMQAMRRAAVDMHRYPDGGAFHLRRAIGRRLSVPPEQILVGNGSNEIIELLGHVFLDRGTSVVVADRAFIVYRLVAEACQAKVIAVPMVNYTHDLKAMARAIRGDTRLVFVANPNNPTGTAVPRASLERFVRSVPRHVIVVLDEAYVEMMPTVDQPRSLAWARTMPNVVVMRTFSKAYGLAGLRIGYAIASADCINLLHKARQPFNVNSMALAAAEASLGDANHVRRTRDAVLRGRAWLERELTRIGVPFVRSAANFMLADVGNGREVFLAMQKERVIVRPMDVYGLPSFVRITVGTTAENKLCITALGRVLAGRTAGKQAR